MDYWWLNVMGFMLGAYFAWRDDQKKERCHRAQQRGWVEHNRISGMDSQTIDSDLDARESGEGGGDGGWDFSGWAD